LFNDYFLPGNPAWLCGLAKGLGWSRFNNEVGRLFHRMRRDE
jgi:hypothetical protein